MIVSGIDEAGLGPLLGPYCAALVSIHYKGKINDPRKLCYSILREDPVPGKLAVGDSKKIYSPGKLLQLEQTVLSFFTLYFGKLPSTAGQLLQTLLPEEPDHEIFREDLPWNSLIQSTRLPLTADPSKIFLCRTKLEQQFARKDLSLERFTIGIVPPATFNSLLDSSRNKAASCQKILSPLLKEGFFPQGRMVVDRQGGRRYYGEWLIDLYPGKMITTGQETSQLSRYHVDRTEIHFQVKADSLCFETSLASMTAKYLRELYMHGFNLYWQSRVPGLKGTAGYYTDGKRFIGALKDAGVLPEKTFALIRKK